jgi:hypothetical protein
MVYGKKTTETTNSMALVLPFVPAAIGFPAWILSQL